MTTATRSLKSLTALPGRASRKKEMNFLPGLNFANIARELKCEGIRVKRPDEINGAIREGLRSSEPTLVEVALDPKEGFPSQP